MSNYVIEIELLSETILGSGNVVPGFVDLEVVHDENGLPYLNGKTLKGRLRKEAENIVALGNEIFFEESLNNIFGSSNKGILNKITFSKCEVSDNIKKLIESQLKNSNEIEANDILDALTDVRYFTSIEKNGTKKDGSLRTIRVINKKLRLIGNITCLNKLEEKEEMLLALSVAGLKHIGLMCSRGKGNVRCLLYKENNEISKKYIRLYADGRI